MWIPKIFPEERCGTPDPYCTGIDWLHKNWERIVTAFGTFSALWHLLLCVFWLSMPFYFMNFVWPCLYATPFHMIQNVCFCIHCDTTVLFNVLNFVRNYTDTVCTVDCTRMKVTLPAKNMFTVIYSSAILTSHWLSHDGLYKLILPDLYFQQAMLLVENQKP